MGSASYVSLVGWACGCVLAVAGCAPEGGTAAEQPQTPAGEWHETAFSRALVLGEDGQALCVGLDCSIPDDTLGAGMWEAAGGSLTLRALSGRLWWPGGTGLAPGNSAVLAYTLDVPTLTLVPDTGRPITYALAGHTVAAPCTAGSALRLLFPRGGEVFAKGEVVRIRWRAGMIINSVQVDLSSDAGETYWNVNGRAIPVADSTWFDWPAEPFDSPAEHCIVRVFDYSNRELGFSGSGEFAVR